MPTTITVTKGFANTSGTFAIIERAEHGGFTDAAGQFDTAPALVCTAWPGSDRISAGSLAATWVDASLALIQIDYTRATIDALDEGRYQLAVVTADTGELVARFVLSVEPGPGTRDARPVYCTYRDLLDERTWIGQMADDLNDETGFAEVRAEARDWTDSETLRRVSICRRDDYTAALSDPGMRLDTPNGRMIVKANVYYTLAKIIGRGVAPGDSNGLTKDAERYAEMAKSTLATCRAEFDGCTPPSIAIGGVITARLVR